MTTPRTAATLEQKGLVGEIFALLTNVVKVKATLREKTRNKRVLRMKRMSLE